MTLSGKDYGHVVWPIDVKPWIKTVNNKNWNLGWTVNLRCLRLEEIRRSKKFDNIILPEDWFGEFGIKKIYTNDLSTNIINSLINKFQRILISILWML